MGERDAEIGQTIATYRGDRSQQWVADGMRARGWKWSQATVWAVEKGDRPLRLLEAQDLSYLLGVPLEHMLLSPIDARVRKLTLKAMDQSRAIEEQTVELLWTFKELRRQALAAKERGVDSPLVEEGIRMIDSDLPEMAVRLGRSAFERAHKGISDG